MTVVLPFIRPEEAREAIAEFSDPFKKGNIDKIVVFCWFPAGGHSPHISANVEYISRNSHGEQKFEEPLTAEGFERMLRRIASFVQSVPE